MLSGVDSTYAAKLTSVNAATLAALAWAPPEPDSVKIGGAVSPRTTLEWKGSDDPGLAGYKIYWRETTAPQWQKSVWIGGAGDGVAKSDGQRLSYTLQNVVIDNYLFAVAAVGSEGDESVTVFPTGVMR